MELQYLSYANLHIYYYERLNIDGLHLVAVSIDHQTEKERPRHL